MSCKCQDLPIPRMYVDPQDALKRINHFKGKHFKKLDPNERIYFDYKADDVVAMINACVSDNAQLVRVYFASYDNGNDAPPGFKNRLTLIFASCSASNNNPTTLKDIKSYHITPNGSFDPIGSVISPTKRVALINNYKNNQLAKISVGIAHNNENEAENNTFCDTRSVSYTIDNLKEFAEEIKCQEAYWVRVNLAAYLPTDTAPKYPDRLITQFSLFDQNWIELNDLACIKSRSSLNEFLFDYDNGQLCPPVNCPS